MDRRWTLLAAAAVIATPVAAQKIDRHALVTRHNITLTKVDPHAPLMVGNGNLGFTADITGLQTFPEQYTNIAPLLTMAQWAWHSFPNPNNWTETDGMRGVAVLGRGRQDYPWIQDWAEVDQRPALKWLRENPHRFSLGRISLSIRRADGSAAVFTDLTKTRQKLDLWTGALTSSFVFDGKPVTVETRVAAGSDTVMVSVRSPLVAMGRIGVDVRYPGVSGNLNPDPSGWTRDNAHETKVLYRMPDGLAIERRIDSTRYNSWITSKGGKIAQTGAHEFHIAASGSDLLTVQTGFSSSGIGDVGDYQANVAKVTQRWHDFWIKGGAIDFSGSSDPRAGELERRVILSQYLSAINGAGEMPPQEEGLFSNSWNGKFHLEVHPLHSAHWAVWGRPELLERSLIWYLNTLPAAQATARAHRVQGAWWTKMAGPEGRNSPSTINPFIMWQQPNPILMAELVWRAHPDKATLDKYGELVDQTGQLLATWPLWDKENGRYVLGPPIVPVQENHPPLATVNPTYELEAFRKGLMIARAWRERRGLKPDPRYDDVIEKLAAPALAGGLYLPVETEPEFWTDTMSPACSKHAEAAPCLNRDHPSMLMAYGLIGGKVDVEAMRRTLRAVESDWDLRQTWGWDFPVIAMTAARLGEREDAVNWLFRDLPNNRWGIGGMTPRVHLEAERQLIGPAAAGSAAGPDGPGYRRAAETYFPSNGSLLLAVAMMAGGWDGSVGPAPGFPKKGWKVRVEGILPVL